MVRIFQLHVLKQTNWFSALSAPMTQLIFASQHFVQHKETTFPGSTRNFRKCGAGCRPWFPLDTLFLKKKKQLGPEAGLRQLAHAQIGQTTQVDH